MKKKYESPEFDFKVLMFERMLTNMQGSIQEDSGSDTDDNLDE